MKNNEQAPRISSEDERNRKEQRDRQEWGENIAKEFEIEYSGEFFEIPHYDKTGKEIKRTRIHAWDKIPFWSEDGKKMVDSADIKDVIRAILKHPEMELRQAIKQTKKESDMEATV